LLLILSASWALRILLAVRGGAFFGSDDSRYVVSRQALSKLLAGDIRGCLDSLFSSADHLMFKVIGLVPALVERFTGESPVVPAIFFGAFSVVIIFLSWRLVQERGGSSTEALFSALLLAECTSFIYYSRHIFPYDLALSFFLLAALMGFRRVGKYSYLAGLFAGLGFLTYNGYWQFGATVLILASFSHGRLLSKFAEYVALGLAGLFTPIGAVLIAGKLLGHDLVKSYIEFSRTVTTGDFGTAWKLYPQYYWAAESRIVFFWALAAVFAGYTWLHRELESRVKIWLGGLLLVYLLLVIPSDALRSVAVYARHGRPIAIFFSLIGGWLLAKYWQQGAVARTAVVVIATLLTLQAAENLAVPLHQEFPRQFQVRAEEILRNAEARDGGNYRILNADLLDGPWSIQDSLPSTVIERSPHPQQYAPYLFDAWNSAYRKVFLSRDISMRVVRVLPEDPEGRTQVSRTAGIWKPFIGGVRLDIMLDPKQGISAQPLVCSGITGAGDQVFIERLNTNEVRLGYDHWSQAATYSDPITCDFSKRHVVAISFGSLFPDDSFGLFREKPSYLSLKHTVLVKFDGKIVIAIKRDSYPATSNSIFLFHNLIGFSSSEREFSGRVFSASPEDLHSDIFNFH
jgi:hypothetical protein